MFRKIAGGLAVVLIGFSLACGVSSTDEAGPETPSDPGVASTAAQGDVTIVKCTADGYGGMDIVVKVKNATKKQQSYSITAEALNAKGNRLGEANGAVNTLSPGETQTKLYGNLDSQEPIKSCRIADVTRFEG